jgi:hypothetical protein
VALTTQPLPGLGGPTSNEKNFPTIKITPFPSNLLSSPATTMANSYSEEEDRIISALEAYRNSKNKKTFGISARESRLQPARPVANPPISRLFTPLVSYPLLYLQKYQKAQKGD